MWIVRLALRRPYTVAIFALAVLLLGAISGSRMTSDIFPTIDVPIVFVVWGYAGMPAEEMERRIVTVSERGMSNSVDGISRMESKSMNGVGLIKIEFEPGADIGGAIGQVVASAFLQTRLMPPGIQPPVIVRFNVSNLPVAQVTVSSDTLPEQQLTDYAQNFVRLRFNVVPGLATPQPYGGRQRQVVVEVDPKAAAANGLSPSDVVSTLLSSNITMPAGAARMGDTEYDVTVNNSPPTVDAFKLLPLKAVGGAVVTLGDVATVTDSFAVQQNVVRVNGKRATYLLILRKAGSSTLTVVESAKALLPSIRAAAPEGMEFTLNFDQSRFVRAALGGVLREAAISSVLVSLTVLFFLGSWRSVVVVSTSIPLSITIGVVALYLTGNTLNVMTLGGFSLAIGMLVDDATVEIENIHRNRLFGKSLTVAILDGARQVATPAIAATLTICIVFLPVFFLQGATRSLFVPLGLSVIFAMLASYLLSRTLVPVLSRALLANEAHHPSAFDRWRDRGFARVEARLAGALSSIMRHRGVVAGALLLLLGVSASLGPVLGIDFFPVVDSGQTRLHVRAPAGTRIEATEQVVGKIEAMIRRVIPGSELQAINDDIGAPAFLFNFAFGASDNSDGSDADIMIALKPDHGPLAVYQQRIRAALAGEFPSVHGYFQTADMIGQVLNFGLAAPIDVEITGKDVDRSMEIARRLRHRLEAVPGAVDVHIPQVNEHPALHVEVDRARAAQIGVTQRDVADNVLTSLSSSTTVAPSFWVNPQNGVQYAVAVRTSLDSARSVEDLYGTPLNGLHSNGPVPMNGQGVAPYLGSLSRIDLSQSRSIVTHDNVARVVDVLLGVEGRDLGAVASDVSAAVAALGKLPVGTSIRVRGQSEAMRSSFGSLAVGLLLAMVLVYGLLVVLYQSWLDPLIIIAAVPGALGGVLWALALTKTTINTESLMGSIMVVGVATSNSILLVSFANDVRTELGVDSTQAAIMAARTRLRPVLMTALAMIVGMVPMALGSGEGGEQNAPLARAVIGGLLAATGMTVFFVPLAYSVLRRAAPTKHRLDLRFAEESRGAQEGGAP